MLSGGYFSFTLQQFVVLKLQLLFLAFQSPWVFLFILLCSQGVSSSMLRFFSSLFTFSHFSNGPLFTSCLIPCPLLSSLEFYFIPCDCVDCAWLSLIFINSQFLGCSLTVFSSKFVLNHKKLISVDPLESVKLVRQQTIRLHAVLAFYKALTSICYLYEYIPKSVFGELLLFFLQRVKMFTQ